MLAVLLPKARKVLTLIIGWRTWTIIQPHWRGVTVAVTSACRATGRHLGRAIRALCRDTACGETSDTPMAVWQPSETVASAIRLSTPPTPRRSGDSKSTHRVSDLHH